MSIVKVEVRTGLGQLLTLTLANASNGFLVKDILGVDPVKANLVSSTFANLDGARFQASRREVRNILFKVGIKPDYVLKTARDLRLQLYSFFTEKTEVSLRFYMEDGLTVNIMGVVESFEAPFFTQEPEANISVVCYDPDFLALTPIEVVGDTVSTLTEFDIDYEGSMPTGFTFVLNVDRSDLGAFTIYQRPADNVLRQFDFAADLDSGDILTVNSVRGNKFITLNRSSTLSSLLYGKSSASPWLELQPGTNHMRIYATGAGVPYTFTYTPRYGSL